ncbi:capsular polysaccharide export protein [Phyllobacterium trifolii]|uniref:Capsular polysaccharide export protein n=1 Tax=Phyllobacterium trifolii TaxID=300193 RepID=A0A839UMD4_9HYPH|nr:capsular polysaccharide biosynthesis protein [Phyllobacterium trifolii]MBB3149751.1 capsular polysaccharide export protein [Phyllobacterium trifolii]
MRRLLSYGSLLAKELRNRRRRNDDVDAYQGQLALPRSIAKQRQVSRILQLAGWQLTNKPSQATAFAGWGRKSSGKQSKIRADRHGKQFIALEDGFLRSIGLGQAGEPPLSIILDPIGIYYDATGRSRLEDLLNEPNCVSSELLERARRGMDLMRNNRLSKYNSAAEPMPSELLHSNYVLVIDQTLGDMSIPCGMASASSFNEMLDAAKSNHPGSRIVIKIHPGVTAGINAGHFPKDLVDVTVVDQSINPWDLIENAEAVYAVTSGMGFEALISGKRVYTFGMPFYAGWGLTTDTVQCERRTSRPTLEEMFAAAYLLYPTYYDPLTDTLSDFETVAHLLSFWRDQNEKHKEPTFCLGMSKWKRKAVSAFLRSTYQEPRFLKSSAEALKLAKASNGRVVVWASKSTEKLKAESIAAGVTLHRMEDGFIRSRGLGSDLVPPRSLVLDSSGIYYDSTRASDLETAIEAGNFSNVVLEQAEQLRLHIVNSGLTKYNVGENYLIAALPNDRKIILVPGQVEDDASIKKAAGQIRSNMQLLEMTRAENPDAFIIFKPHPDVDAGNRHGYINPNRALRFADYVETRLSSDAAINQVDEVWTMTSLLGFEALLRNKAVTCFGMPFYAGWGLTTDKQQCARRKRRAQLTEVIAAAYICYPSFIDDNFHRVPVSRIQ